MIPLSLYIHIPWCEKKCPYCDFNSHLAKTDISDPKAQNQYIQALLADLAQDIERFANQLGSRKVSTVFIGGGTPSLFSSKAIQNLIDGVKDIISLEATAEVTLESNPGSSEASKFEGFLEAGVNRLSIGIQSFNDNALQRLGRVHSASQAIAAAKAAKQAGFKRLNLDIMFGLPNQSLAASIEDIEQAIELEPDHISAYELTLEPNTLFHNQPPKLPKDEMKWQMYEALQQRLASSGYQQYEVSAYAKATQQCRHNINYWEFGDYLGIGAGAHSKMTDTEFQIQRSWKIKHPTTYLNALASDDSSLKAVNRTLKAVGDTKKNSSQDTAFEFMLNAMRLTGGFDLALFEDRTGLALETIQTSLNKHMQMGLLEISDGRVKTNLKGRQFIDTMLQDYL